MSLTPTEVASARRCAEQTTAAQGLPLTVTDPGTLAKVAVLAKPTAKSREVVAHD